MLLRREALAEEAVLLWPGVRSHALTWLAETCHAKEVHLVVLTRNLVISRQYRLRRHVGGQIAAVRRLERLGQKQGWVHGRVEPSRGWHLMDSVTRWRLFVSRRRVSAMALIGFSTTIIQAVIVQDNLLMLMRVMLLRMRRRLR